MALHAHGLVVSEKPPIRPRVVYAWPYVEWGGVQVYFLNLIRAAHEEFDVRVVAPAASSPTLFSFLEAEAVEAERMRYPSDMSPVETVRGRVRRRWRKVRAERELGQRLLKLAEEPPTLFHVDLAPWTSGRLLASLARYHHLFVTLHTRLPEVDEKRRRLWKKRWSALSTLPKFHVLAANLDVRSSLEPYLGPEVHETVPLAYSGVDLDQLSASLDETTERSPLARRLQVPGDRLFVTVAGQFIERKGCWTFLEAAAELHRRHPELFFLWFGMDTLSPRTQERLTGFQNQGYFRYIRSQDSGVTHPEFLRTLATMTDLFVLPSLIEGLPLVLVEMMAMGKAIVATEINAVPEAIEHGASGLLVSPGDTRGLVDAIERIVGDPDVRKQLGTAARQTAVDRFDQRRTNQITFAEYRKALASVDRERT